MEIFTCLNCVLAWVALLNRQGVPTSYLRPQVTSACFQMTVVTTLLEPKSNVPGALAMRSSTMMLPQQRHDTKDAEGAQQLSLRQRYRKNGSEPDTKIRLSFPLQGPLFWRCLLPAFAACASRVWCVPVLVPAVGCLMKLSKMTENKQYANVCDFVTFPNFVRTAWLLGLSFFSRTGCSFSTSGVAKMLLGATCFEHHAVSLGTLAARQGESNIRSFRRLREYCTDIPHVGEQSPEAFVQFLGETYLPREKLIKQLCRSASCEP